MNAEVKVKQKSTSKFSKIEIALLTIFSALKINIEDYCDLETTDGHYNLVLKDGTLVSLIEYEGARTIVSQKVFHEQMERLTAALAVFFGTRGHSMGFVFRRDLNAGSELFRIAEMQRQTAKALELNVDFLIQEGVDVYEQFIYDETCYIVMISRPMLLDAAEMDLEAKRKKGFRKEFDIPAMADAQSLLLPISFLRPQHETFCDRLLTELKNPDFAAQATKIDVSTALKRIKMAVAPNTTSENWTPFVPGGNMPIPLRWKNNLNARDISHIMYPTLPEQIMKQGVAGAENKQINGNQYPIGSVVTDGRIYAPLMIDIPPQLGASFNDLFRALDDARTEDAKGVIRSMPYAVSFMLTGDGMAGTALKNALSSVLAFASANNANVKSSIEALKQYKNQGGTVVALQIAAMTWAPNNEVGLDSIQIYRSKLWRILEGWGHATVMQKGGDPLLAWRSNIPALSAKHHALKCPAPLYDALSILPFARPASPFKHGTILSRSVDGKLMRIEKFSSEQTTWVSVYTGKPGSGKSVAMNNDIIETCLMPGLKRLPLIFMIDVGVSSQGPINLLQDHLHINKKYQAVYKRLKNDADMSINPLDCAVGLMKPLIEEGAQMAAFVTALVTAKEAEGQAEEGMFGFVSAVIDEVYATKEDGIVLENSASKGNPNRYEPFRNPELDELLAKLHVEANGKTYFALVKELHQLAGSVGGLVDCYRARDLCHRYAMPTLSDIQSVANSTTIQERYKQARTKQGEPLIDYFSRSIIEASSLFPVFFHHTKFDLDTARVISLDLQDVIGTNKKQTSLFFQIARIFAKKRIAFTTDDIKYFPDYIKRYYERKIEELAEDRKVMAYDELHNAKKDEFLFAELTRDAREARKWGMELCLASQKMEDMQELLEFVTRFVIADRGTDKSREYLREHIGLLPVEEAVLRDNVNLSPAGLTYFSRIVCKQATYSSLITLTIGPQRIWALTTDAEERLLRQNMYDMTNDRPLSLLILGTFYPSGAKKFIQLRKEAAKAKHGGSDEEKEELDSITRDMARELIGAYNQHQRDRALGKSVA